MGYKCGEYEANDESRHTYVKPSDHFVYINFRRIDDYMIKITYRCLKFTFTYTNESMIDEYMHKNLFN